MLNLIKKQNNTMPVLRLGDVVPNFTAESTKGLIKFYEWQNNMWVILLSHPKDFTPVCTSEMATIAEVEPCFEKRNAKFLAHSCDTVEEHLAWEKDIIGYCKHLPTNELLYPIIADKNGDLARLLNLFDANNYNNELAPVTTRALYIIDPQHKLRFSLHYPATTGRNLKEILRILDSIQLTDRIPQIETPVNWMPGEKVLVKSNVGECIIRRIFPKGTLTEYSSATGRIQLLLDYDRT